MASLEELLRPFREARRQWYLPRAFFPYPDRIDGMPGFRRFLQLLAEYQMNQTSWDRERELEVLIMLEDEGITPKWIEQEDYHAEFRNRVNIAKKLGFAISGADRPLALTETGRLFITSQAEELPDLIEHQLVKMQFAFPDLPQPYSHFKVFPYLFVISALLDSDGNYKTQDEFTFRVMLASSHNDKDSVVQWLRDFRSLPEADRQAARSYLDQNHLYAARMWLLLFSNSRTIDFNDGILSVRDLERARWVWARCWPRLTWQDYSEEEWGRWMGTLIPGLWPLFSENAREHINMRREYVKREESDTHKAIKRYLIEKCEELFGTGAKLLEEEYSYPSGDAANLVFTLPDGRFLAVEVEVDVGPSDTVGLLQAIKYKYMLAVQERRSFEQVDAMLAARRVHSEIRKLCDQYGVRCLEVSI